MIPRGRNKEILLNFAEMLDYPCENLQDIILECQKLIEIEDIAAPIDQFKNFVEMHTTEKLEEIYSGIFDLNPFCCLYLGYHLFGESYLRSAFLLGLKEQYNLYNFSSGKELPDHLTIVLRFLATIDDIEVEGEIIKDALLPAIDKILKTLGEDSVDQDEKPSSFAYVSLLIALRSVLQETYLNN